MGDVIRVLAYTGIRWGEMAALEVGSIDLDRRRASIYRTVVDTKGGLVWKNPKGHSQRSVPIPASIIDRLAAVLDGRPADEHGVPLPQGHGAARLQRPADVVEHGSHRGRSTDGIPPARAPASLVISTGANVKAVQQMLGHKSASLTWTPTPIYSRTTLTRSQSFLIQHG